MDKPKLSIELRLLALTISIGFGILIFFAVDYLLRLIFE